MVEARAPPIVDVGGESAPPPAPRPSRVDEELRPARSPVVRALAERGLCVSIDTRHAEVARAAVEAGASIVNDVSGFRDPAMVDVARSCDAGLVVVHMQGEPGTMQENPTYDDVVVEVRDYLVGQAALLEQAGVARDRICLDPGPGFGKTPKQTLELVRNLHGARAHGLPGHGGAVAQELHRLRVPHRRPGGARPRVGGRSAHGVRAGGERRAHAQCGRDRAGAQGPAAFRAVGAGLQRGLGRWRGRRAGSKEGAAEPCHRAAVRACPTRR